MIGGVGIVGGVGVKISGGGGGIGAGVGGMSPLLTPVGGPPGGGKNAQAGEVQLIAMMTPANANTDAVTTLGQARNFLYLLDPGNFPTVDSYLAALQQTQHRLDAARLPERPGALGRQRP